VTELQRIEPRTLKGFRDYLPEAMIPRERLVDTARRVYRSYGFSPIDTPALEYFDILAGKGGEETDKQLYQFQDHGGRHVGLRFDLTVPLARFVAQHCHELSFPFKRYQVAAVWRGENTQRGRYREFMQCDFDTIGTRSAESDVEAVLVIYDLMRSIGFEQFTIRLNHRMVLNGVLQQFGLAEQAAAVLRVWDKLEKIGLSAAVDEVTAATGIDKQQAGQIFDLVAWTGDNQERLRNIETVLASSAVGMEGVSRLREVTEGVKAAGVPESAVQLDLSIARGLDYYTGLVFETYLTALPAIGSVCSGGRYDNLASLFTAQELPGIGGSLGLDRLLAAMEELGMIEKVATPAPVFIPFFDRDHFHDYLRLAARIRAETIRDEPIGVEVYPEPKKLGQQLKYADRRGFRVALIAGRTEFEAGVYQVKDLRREVQRVIPAGGDAAELLTAIREIIDRP
jgi:histidyl-tRNA synthetase